MKKTRKIRDEADERSCMAAAARSGLGATGWARSVGIDGRSLRAWTMNLQRGAAATAEVAKAVQLVEHLVEAAVERPVQLCWAEIRAAALQRVLPRQWGTQYYQSSGDAAKKQVLQDLAAYIHALSTLNTKPRHSKLCSTLDSQAHEEDAQ